MVTEFIFEVKHGKRKYCLWFSIETEFESIIVGDDFTIIDNQIVRIVGKNLEINGKASHKDWEKAFMLTREESGVAVEFKNEINFIDAVLHEQYSSIARITVKGTPIS